MCQQIDKGHRGKWNQQPVYCTMAGKWSNAASPGEWIRNGEVSRESYLWVINPILYTGEPAGAMELRDGWAQERWRSGSRTQEQRDCRQKVRGSGESTLNIRDQKVTDRDECVGIVLLMTGDRWWWLVIRWVGSGVCSWWWLRWLWLPDSTPSYTTATGPATASGCGPVWVAVMEIGTGMGWVPWWSAGGSSVHTRPREGNGSSCAGCHGSRPRGTSLSHVSSAQSGRWSGGDIRRRG